LAFIASLFSQFPAQPLLLIPIDRGTSFPERSDHSNTSFFIIPYTFFSKYWNVCHLIF
jgi:hypothetical protein